MMMMTKRGKKVYDKDLVKELNKLGMFLIQAENKISIVEKRLKGRHKRMEAVVSKLLDHVANANMKIGDYIEDAYYSERE
jgi:hypothetical protein